MSDVRAMLRAERASRAPVKVKPQAPAQTRLLATATSLAPASRKRKADDDDDVDLRKRTKAEEVNNLPAGFFDGSELKEDDQGGDEAEEEPGIVEALLPGFVPAQEVDPTAVTANELQQAQDEQPSKPSDTLPHNPASAAPIDEDEWASFQEFANQVSNERPAQPSHSGAVLEAAPVTAEELAAQERQEQARVRERRQEDIEAEKEEAARNLEDEFEVMESLEDRVKKLKEKRENLRNASPATEEAVKPVSTMPTEQENVAQESDESDDDVDEFDGWRFGGS